MLALGFLSWRNAFFAACAALVVSHVARQPSPPQVSVTTVAAAPTTCTTELAACRAESWNIVARTIRTEVEERRPPPLEPTREPTGGDAQRATRCDVAEQQAREHWVRERANIYASVKDVGTPAWIERETKKTLAAMQRELGVAPSEREYAALWAKHGPIFRAALANEDWAVLIEVVRSFWRDEDALVERTLGARVRDERRALELRSRTAIMAILAALADKPFDDAIVW